MEECSVLIETTKSAKGKQEALLVVKPVELVKAVGTQETQNL